MKKISVFVIKRTFLLFILSWGILILWLFAVYVFTNHEKRIVFEQNELQHLQVLITRMSERKETVIEDVFFLASVGGNDQVFYNNPKAINAFSNIATSLLQSHQGYRSIQLFDTSGTEFLRIKRDDSGIKIIYNDDIQKTADNSFSFFSLFQNFQKDYIHVYPQNLNMVLTSLNETFPANIRYIVKVYDKTTSDPLGFLILDWSADDVEALLHKFAYEEECIIHVIDSHGNCLGSVVGEDSELKSFIGKNIEQQNPDLWKMMVQNSSGLYTYRHRLDFFSLVDSSNPVVFKILELNTNPQFETFSIGHDSPELFILAELSPNRWAKYISLAKQVFLLLAFVAIPIILLLAYLWTRKEERNIELHKQLYHDATRDIMTGTYNRKAGFKFIQQAIDKSQNAGASPILCFFDLNNLKRINDQLGHDKGDLFISTFVRVLRQFMHGSDRIARFGGDEFLAVCEVESLSMAKEHLLEINSILGEKGREVNCSIPWSVSYGCLDIKENNDMGVDALVQKADKLMYQHKQQMKKEQATASLNKH
ncbi:MAG: sensor domain-containing diguanylate cyclase [Spirochaetia bacterium]|jgi:diguanylate cyclase (GGDEF)-like protein|nr:sensor domain-containing diguanylate cyclase [Spirochaetia bacterium]